MGPAMFDGQGVNAFAYMDTFTLIICLILYGLRSTERNRKIRRRRVTLCSDVPTDIYVGCVLGMAPNAV